MLNKNFFDYAGFSLSYSIPPKTFAKKIEQVGSDLRAEIEKTRKLLANSLSVQEAHIILTMGTTQGFKQLLLCSSIFPEKQAVVVSDLVYPKIYRLLQARCSHIKVAPVSEHENGERIAECLAQEVDDSTAALVTNLVDNRRGIEVSLKCLYEKVKQKNPNCQVIIDASQGYRQLPSLKTKLNHYDFLVADLKKWCGYKTFTGTGFLFVSDPTHLKALARIADTQYAVHPSLLKTETGMADAGGNDVWNWCVAQSYLEKAFRTFESRNHQQATNFFNKIKAFRLPEKVKPWPSEPSDWTTGIVSFIGPSEQQAALYEKLQEYQVDCSLIPTDLEPYPSYLQQDQSCLRFSFHDQKTSEQDIENLLELLQRIGFICAPK